LKDESYKSEITSNKEIDRLRVIISEKIAEIKEYKADEHHQKQTFDNQLIEYRDIINKKTEIIDDMDEELQKRNDRIDQLIDSLEDMRKNISSSNEADTAAIYEQEF
jgi:chromosome segregation ATPase